MRVRSLFSRVPGRNGTGAGARTRARPGSARHCTGVIAGLSGPGVQLAVIADGNTDIAARGIAIGARKDDAIVWTETPPGCDKSGIDLSRK